MDSDVAEDHDGVLVDLVVGTPQARHQRRQPALAHNLGGIVRRRREVPQRQQGLLFRSVVLMSSRCVASVFVLLYQSSRE